MLGGGEKEGDSPVWEDAPAGQEGRGKKREGEGLPLRGRSPGPGAVLCVLLCCFLSPPRPPPLASSTFSILISTVKSFFFSQKEKQGSKESWTTGRKEGRGSQVTIPQPIAHGLCCALTTQPVLLPSSTTPLNAHNVQNEE